MVYKFHNYSLFTIRYSLLSLVVWGFGCLGVWGAVSVADFTHAAVTDMNPGVLLPVTKLAVEGETPYLWYAAAPGTHYFYGDADGDGATQYEVTVKEAGFYRFRNPGKRFTLLAASVPVALWFGDGPVWFRPVDPGAVLWYAPPNWHVHLDEFPAEQAERTVSKTGCAFLSKDRWWHVGAFPAAVGKAKAEGLKGLKGLEGLKGLKGLEKRGGGGQWKAAHRIALFNNALGYRHTGALEAGPVAFGKAAAKIGYALDVVTDLQKLGDAAFLAQYDAVVLNSTSGVDEEKVPGVSRALPAYVAAGKGLVLLHAAIDAFYKSPEVQKMNGAVLWGHPWSAPGTWSFVNEAGENPINAPFRDKPALLKYSDEIYQTSTPPFDRKNCDVLLSVDMSDMTTAAAVARWRSTPYGRDKWRADNDYVVSFTKSHGKGRVFYTSFGHDGRAFCDERFAHMMLGLQWTLGDLEVPAKKPRPDLVDKLWMWGHEPECWHRFEESFGRLGLSVSNHCGQAEGCRLMGIRRDCIIRWLSLPQLPVSDEWLKPFAGLDEVAWSITDSDKDRTFLEKVDVAIEMKKRLPNLTTVFLDDYFQSHMRPLSELEEARKRVHAAGMKIAAVMYADVEGLRESDLPSAKLCDVIALWFWKPASFDTMEAKVREAKKFLGGQRMMLGLYMWDFGAQFGPVTGEKMKAQLAVAERLLREGTVEGLVFHPTMSADMDVPAVRVSKAWIRAMGLGR